MNNNVEFLNYISINSEMGFISIRDILSEVKDKEFRDILNEQATEYEEIYDQARELLENYDEEPVDVNEINKIVSYVTIKLNLLTNKEPSHIAEIITKGSNAGIIDIKKKLNCYDTLDKKVTHLGERLLKFEEKNVEQMTEYLKEEE